MRRQYLMVKCFNRGRVERNEHIERREGKPHSRVTECKAGQNIRLHGYYHPTTRGASIYDVRREGEGGQEMQQICGQTAYI